MAEERRKLWERMPAETNESWVAFNEYIKLSPVAEEPSQKRKLKNVAERLNINPDTISRWSAHNAWVERARAYDDDMALTVFEAKAVTLADFQRDVIRRESEEIAAAQNILRDFLRDMQNDISAGNKVKSTDVKNALEMVDRMALLGRRLAQLPASYTSAKSENTLDDETEEPATFIIGGGARG